jgi:phage tail sheath gpL-like
VSRKLPARMPLFSALSIGVIRVQPVVRPAKNWGAASMAARIADNVAVEDSGERLVVIAFAACDGRAAADAAIPTTTAATTKIKRIRRVLTCRLAV